MKTPSTISALQKIKVLLTAEEKMQWLGMVAFALASSCLEVLTAAVIVVFAQVLNDPDQGQQYLNILKHHTGMHPVVSPGRTIFYIAVFVGIIYLIKNIIAAAEVFYQNFSIQKMNYHFKNKLLHRYAEADYDFYLTRNSSLGLAVVEGDAEQIFSMGLTSIGMALSEGLVLICLIVMVIYMNPALAVVILSAGLMIGFLITKKLLPYFYHWGQRLQEASLYSGQHLLEFFHGFKEIVLFGKKETFINVYQYHSHQKSRVQAIQTAANALPRLIIEILFIILFVTAVAFLCSEHENPNQIIGILGGYFYAGFRLMPGLNRIINQLNNFKGIIPSVERVYSEYQMLSGKENYIDCPTLTFEQSISLNHICFRYQNAEQNALSQVSLEIKKGECVGIVGETGSGKSTLVDVILGLLKPYAGAILVDEQYPVHAYQWHQKIGYVPQNIYLTDDSIEKNIAFGETEVDVARLEAAIEAAQLPKFIEGLPEGTKTIVGERGIRLSGGERQRIAIARALYRSPEVLIFDEATSALDNETEVRLMETMLSVSKNRTVIMIAHRLTTLQDCDRIVVMDNGKIKEVTNYNALQNKMVKHA